MLRNMTEINKLIVLIALAILPSCTRKRNEFIPLHHMTFENAYDRNALKVSYYVLIDNPETPDEKLKNAINKYVRERLRINTSLAKGNVASLNFVFYSKTRNTSYFITHPERSDKMSSEEISNYKEDYIATYQVKKCDQGTEEKLYLYDAPEEIVFYSCKQ